MFEIPFGPKNVTVTEAYEKIGTDGHILLDVRTLEEVCELHVPGSLHIPLDRLESEVGQLRDYTSIHVMCRSGGRSAMATNLLHSLGLSHVENVSGGIMEWQAAGLPTQ